MQVNKYLFGDCKVELRSEEPIIKEKEFSAFLSDYSSADYTLNVIRAEELPEKSGEKLHVSDRRTVCYDGRTKLYTAYFDLKCNSFVDYACKIDNSELYIKSSDRFGEIPIFDSINLPDMLLEKGIGILHCSYIEYKGSAILFSGDKQVGKSTQAALWHEHRCAETINGDRATISIEKGIVYANGIPFCGTSDICKNKKNPLRAIVCLEKGKENRIEKLSAANAFMTLIGKFTYDAWNAESAQKLTDIVQSVVESVPVYSYSCVKNETAVDFLEQEIYQP